MNFGCQAVGALATRRPKANRPLQSDAGAANASATPFTLADLPVSPPPCEPLGRYGAGGTESWGAQLGEPRAPAYPRVIRGLDETGQAGSGR
jgi:hypothetical protein